MLTKLIEQDRPKADIYWPENVNESLEYYPMIITLLSVDTKKDFIVRKIKVERKDDPNDIELDHIQYIGWPDFGVPRDLEIYAECYKTYRHAREKVSGPIVAHCSAGIGRSGTFIAIDMLLDNISYMIANSPMQIINIPRLVHELRTQRPGMVQTKHQFTFIYEFIDYCIQKSLFVASKSSLKN